MASCITSQWSNSSTPQVKLEVTVSSNTDTSATLSWTLYYIATSAANTSVNKSYTVTVAGQSWTGTYDIDGKTGTKTIASGTKSITKTTSAQTISFTVSFGFNLTWSGVYGGTKSASGSISVSAKTKYTIAYNANGGSGAPGSQTKWHGTNITLSSTKPTRTGHSFQGWALTKALADAGTWYYQAGGTCGKNENLTLYAVWEANTYPVTFNANGGSGAPGTQTKTYGVALTLASTVPTRTNYNFLGWATSASSTTVSYKPGGSYTTNSAITLYAVWQLAYHKPRITNFEVSRTDSPSMTISFDWACDLLNASVTVEWRTASNSEWYALYYANQLTVTSGHFEQTFTSADGVSADETYTIRVTVQDANDVASASRTSTGTRYAIDLLAGGNGIAFGKVAERSGYAEFGYSPMMMPMTTLSTIDGDGNPIGVLCPQDEVGDVVLGYSQYADTGKGTLIYGREVKLCAGTYPNGTWWRPYICAGDTIKFTLRTAGYVTNSGTDVTFFVPLSLPVIGKPSVTAASVKGLVLRQGNAYTHGSSASVFVHPDSYSAGRICSESTISAEGIEASGVYVTAKFSDTTNVTNNDAIGIYWDGAISFA